MLTSEKDPGDLAAAAVPEFAELVLLVGLIVGTKYLLQLANPEVNETVKV